MADTKSAVDPDDRAQLLLLIVWFFTVWALAHVAVKFYTRIKIIGETSFDDFLILASMVSFQANRSVTDADAIEKAQ